MLHAILAGTAVFPFAIAAEDDIAQDRVVILLGHLRGAMVWESFPVPDDPAMLKLFQREK